MVFLPIAHLGSFHSVDDSLLEQVISHLVEIGYLPDTVKWGHINGKDIKENDFATPYFPPEFDDDFTLFSTLVRLQRRPWFLHTRWTREHCQNMEHPSYIGIGCGTGPPDAHRMHTASTDRTSAGARKWKDIICSFGYYRRTPN